MEEFVSFFPTDSQNIVTINWANHINHIVKQLKLFFGPGGMFDSDVNVVCGGGTVRCHQILLAIGSDYFADIFTKNSFDRTTMVLLPNISAKVFRYIYQFMLNGTITLPPGEVNAFILAGQELKVDGLMRSGQKVLTAVSSNDDASGVVNKTVLISSNHAKTPLNVTDRGTVHSLQLLKSEENGFLPSTSASVLNQVQSTHKSMYNVKDTNLHCSEDQIEFHDEQSNVSMFNHETHFWSEKRSIENEPISNNGNGNDASCSIRPQQSELILNSQGSISSITMTGIFANEMSESNANNNAANRKEDQLCEKNVEMESCDKYTQKTSCEMDVEMQSYKKDAGKKASDIDIESESSENDNEKESCVDEVVQDSIENGLHHTSNGEEVNLESSEKGDNPELNEDDVEHESSVEDAEDDVEDESSVEDAEDDVEDESSVEDAEDESSEEDLEDESSKEDVEDESSEEDLEDESSKEDVEDESSEEEEVGQKSKENKVDEESNEEDVGQQSYDNDTENVSSISKYNSDNIGKKLICREQTDEDGSIFESYKSGHSEYVGLNSNIKSVPFSTQTTNATNNLRVCTRRSYDRYPKRQHNCHSQSSTSNHSVKRRRKGSIEYRGKNYTIKEAKEIKAFCPDCYIPLKLSNLKNHQRMNCKKINSSEKELEGNFDETSYENSETSEESLSSDEV